MEAATKRPPAQQLAETSHSNNRKFVEVIHKPQRTSRRKILWNILIALVITAGVLWLKSGEDWYSEIVSSSSSLDFDPYQVLAVPKNANVRTIKEQYRKLSLIWHPDRRSDCDDDCRATFKRISDSYKILSSPERRQLYDTTAKVMKRTSGAFDADLQFFEYSYTPDVWDMIVKPSLEGKQLGMADHISGVWVVYVSAGSADPSTDRRLLIFSDLAAHFYGRVTFLRIDASKYPDFESRMPFRVRMKPAYFMMSSLDAPLFFTDMMNFSPQTFAEWIVENMPNPLRQWEGSDKELAEYISNYTSMNPIVTNRKIPVAVISKNLPGSLIRAAATKTDSVMEWIQPQSSSFMEHLGSYIHQKSANIKNGAAIVTTIDGEPYVKIISAKSFRIDRVTREHSKDEEISQTTAGKYLQLMSQLTHKILLGNAVTGYKENYVRLCGGDNENVYCNVMLSERASNDVVKNWIQDHGGEVHHMYLPKKHKNSELSKLLSAPEVQSVLVQLKTETMYAVYAGKVGAPQSTANHRRFFSTYKKSLLEQLYIWCRKHPIATLTSTICTVSVIGVLYGLRVYFTRRNSKKSD